MGFASRNKNSPYQAIVDHVNLLEEAKKPNVILNSHFMSLYALDAADTLGINSAILTFLGPEFICSTTSPYPRYFLPYSINNMTFGEAVINSFYQQFELPSFGIRIWGLVRKITLGNTFIWNWYGLMENRLVLMLTTPEFSPQEALPSRFVYIGASTLAGHISMGKSRTFGQDGSNIVKTNEFASNDVSTWMNEKLEANIDVIYVTLPQRKFLNWFVKSFGTVAHPSERDFINILNGLVSKNRAVLWSIKSAIHSATKNTTIPKNLLESNVRLENWVQQKEILAHPATKVFFTHGGLNSVVEGVTHGLPMICRPTFADQPYNCQRLKDLGVSESVKQDIVLPQDIAYIAEKILSQHPKYKKNAEKIGKSFRLETFKSIYNSLPLQRKGKC
ncbi:hypothetical protein HK096_003854 [Nowakowskiella sp. JEL0078]|nr:hypothetical protein HK096_003854 [Nowakowskiella sp. JEL0078]